MVIGEDNQQDGKVRAGNKTSNGKDQDGNGEAWTVFIMPIPKHLDPGEKMSHNQAISKRNQCRGHLHKLPNPPPRKTL